MDAAQGEARRRNQLVEPSHLLLAILRAPDCGAYRLIERKVQSTDELAAKVLTAAVAAPVQREIAANKIPFSKRAKVAIDRSVKDVMSPPRHWNSCDVLIGIVRDGESPAAQILETAGVTENFIDSEIQANGLAYFFDDDKSVVPEGSDG